MSLSWFLWLYHFYGLFMAYLSYEEVMSVRLCVKWKWNALLFLRYESSSVISKRLRNLRCSIYDHKKNEQLLNFHTIKPQNPTCKAPNRFQESYNVKYFKVIKRLKTPQKAESYLEPKRTSMMELFYEHNDLLFSQ